MGGGGGWSDSYAIHETRRDVKSSIWVGLGVWSGSFLVSPIYETGCLVELYSVRDLEKMGSCSVGSNKVGLFVVLRYILEGLGEAVL